MNMHTSDTETNSTLPREIIIQRLPPEGKAESRMAAEAIPHQEPDSPLGFESFRQDLEKREVELKERILSNICMLTPLDVMMAAMDYMRMVCMSRSMADATDRRRNAIEELHDNNALLVPEYLQSVLVVLDQAALNEEASGANKQAALAELFDDCEELVEIGRPLKMARAVEAVGDGNWDNSLGQFQLESKLYEDLRGKRYQVLEEPYLRYLIEGQDDLIQEIYGISGSKVVDGAIALMDSLIKGWQATIDEMRGFMDEFETLDQNDRTVMDQFRHRVVESNCFARLFGPNLFDVEAITGWPAALIGDLSLDAFSGREATHTDFEDLDPVESLPIRKRPFIRIGEKSYCFCYANYLDNFYRALYDAAKRRYKLQHPQNVSAFSEQWNNAQAKASEDAVADLFIKLLPGSAITQNSYHPLSGTIFNKKCYEESDLVVRYEDVLLSVEVKAGSYCPTDPIDDPEGHVASLKALVEKAASQAQSTVDYVRRCSGGTCRLYDKDGGILYEFSTDDIKLFFKICVTVDDINEFATKIEKIGMVNVPEGTIAISIDDLLVYERYFDNPLIFLHFLLERRRAASNPLVKLNDELDHLGYYIWTNCYSEHISREQEETSKDGRMRTEIVADGFRNGLNCWFESLYEGKSYPKPVQENPAVFNEIITALFEKCDSSYRRRVACSLLDLDSNTREHISASIKARVSSTTTVPPNSMIEIPAASDDDVAVSLFIASPFCNCDWATCREKAISGMLTRDDEERIVMLCTWSGANEVHSCEVEMLRKDGITESERAAASRYDSSVRKMRNNAATIFAGRKVGRNEPCPCGSGKKFKRCCGR